MSLLDVRKKFIDLSGRFDLVVDTAAYADNGADFFIREGSRMLDRLAPEVNREDSAFSDVSAGDYSIFLDNVRVIKSVYVYDASTGSRGELREVTGKKIREWFPQILSQDSQGIPAVYAPVNTVARIGDTITPAEFLTGLKVTATNINGIVFPPVDRDLVIEVQGKFYSTTLTLDVDENYWTRNHMMLLVWAALYKLEVSYRNSEGAKDWLAAINGDLVQIDMDSVEQDSENLAQLGGREND